MHWARNSHQQHPKQAGNNVCLKPPVGSCITTRGKTKGKWVFWNLQRTRLLCCNKNDRRWQCYGPRCLRADCAAQGAMWIFWKTRFQLFLQANCAWAYVLLRCQSWHFCLAFFPACAACWPWTKALDKGRWVWVWSRDLQPNWARDLQVTSGFAWAEGSACNCWICVLITLMEKDYKAKLNSNKLIHELKKSQTEH